MISLVNWEGREGRLVLYTPTRNSHLSNYFTHTHLQAAMQIQEGIELGEREVSEDNGGKSDCREQSSEDWNSSLVQSRKVV